MAIRVENPAEIVLPKNTLKKINLIVDSVPREHLRGIDCIRLVNAISDPRLKNAQQRTELPGLYHPRQGTQQAWLEVAIGVLLPRSKPFLKRLMPRMSFKGNLAAVLFSLIGQHYYLTLRHSIRRGQVEGAVRAYTERQLRQWSDKQGGLRAKLFKPFQPTLERWGRALQKKAAAEKKKQS